MGVKRAPGPADAFSGTGVVISVGDLVAGGYWGSRVSAQRERGQTLVVITVFMMSLLGMSAMAIDVGTWYQDKRHLQSDADAAALAGASAIATNTASTVASANFSGNKLSGETLTVELPAYDTRSEEQPSEL